MNVWEDESWRNNIQCSLTFLLCKILLVGEGLTHQAIALPQKQQLASLTVGETQGKLLFVGSAKVN